MSGTFDLSRNDTTAFEGLVHRSVALRHDALAEAFEPALASLPAVDDVL